MRMFNPFGKPLERIERADIDILVGNHVAEGQFVEYKSIFPPDASKIAKSIASFANTSGGWYIVGVHTNANNEADRLEGFSIPTNFKPKEHVRNTVRGNIQPVPL